jgi:flagellar basal body rod protein FlgC
MMAAAARLTQAASNIAADTTPSSSSGASTPPYRPAYVAPVSLMQGTSVGDLPTDVVDQSEALNAFKANVAVFKAADDMMKSLLDMKL